MFTQPSSGWPPEPRCSRSGRARAGACALRRSNGASSFVPLHLRRAAVASSCETRRSAAPPRPRSEPARRRGLALVEIAAGSGHTAMTATDSDARLACTISQSSSSRTTRPTGSVAACRRCSSVPAGSRSTSSSSTTAGTAPPSWSSATSRARARSLREPRLRAREQPALRDLRRPLRPAPEPRHRAARGHARRSSSRSSTGGPRSASSASGSSTPTARSTRRCAASRASRGCSATRSGWSGCPAGRRGSASGRSRPTRYEASSRATGRSARSCWCGARRWRARLPRRAVLHLLGGGRLLPARAPAPGGSSCTSPAMTILHHVQNASRARATSGSRGRTPSRSCSTRTRTFPAVPGGVPRRAAAPLRAALARRRREQRARPGRGVSATAPCSGRRAAARSRERRGRSERDARRWLRGPRAPPGPSRRGERGRVGAARAGLLRDGPGVTGATGGSGTRVVARVMRRGGMFIGTDLNVSEDALDFAAFSDRWIDRYWAARRPPRWPPSCGRSSPARAPRRRGGRGAGRSRAASTCCRSCTAAARPPLPARRPRRARHGVLVEPDAAAQARRRGPRRARRAGAAALDRALERRQPARRRLRRGRSSATATCASASRISAPSRRRRRGDPALLRARRRRGAIAAEEVRRPSTFGRWRDARTELEPR